MGSSIKEKLEYQIKLKKISEMENPTILMNSSDFKLLKIEVESMIENFEIKQNPVYRNIPIKVSDFLVEKGNIIVYDDIISKDYCL